MSNLPLFAFAAILAAALLQAWSLLRNKAERLSVWPLLAAALLLAVFFGARSLEIGFLALTGTFESLLFYAAFVCLVLVLYRFQRRLPYLPLVQFGASIIALALLAIASSPIAPKEALPPIPALRSGWLALHVSFSFIGEAFFVASFVAALAFLATKDEEKRLAYDRVAYTTIALGYPIFTTGAMVFGAIWAEQAWGSWWSWDPKETWALVTWLVYTFYLHLRLIRKRTDSLVAWVAVIGFLSTLFTFFGVNFLLSGLHSYG